MSAQLALAPIQKSKGPQLQAVYNAMQRGEWFTLGQLTNRLWRWDIGISEAGVSARIRDLRKAEYGGHTIDRMPTERKGIFVYRMRQDG